MFNLVAGLGCLLAGPSSDYFGRKTNLMGGNVLNICGTLITCLNNVSKKKKKKTGGGGGGMEGEGEGEKEGG